MKKTVKIITASIIATMLLSNAVFAQEEASTQNSSQDDIIQQLLQQVANLTKQITELQLQITKLTEQKKEVVKTVEVKTKESKEKYIPVIFLRPMYIGVIGDDVILLQEFLATDSDIYPEGIVSGYYGALTKKAVKRLQKKFGLEMGARVLHIMFLRVEGKTNLYRGQWQGGRITTKEKEKQI